MRINKRSVFPVLLIIIIMITASILFTGVVKQADAKTKSPNLIQGNLDLSNWNAGQNGLIRLAGKWEFYWEKLLSDQDLKGNNISPDLLVKVPDVWNNYKLNGKSLPGYGYATYRLKVKNVQEGAPLAIRMPTTSTSYRLYIDHKLIASNGIVGEDSQHFTPEYRPKTAVFTPTSKDFDIILQVANFSYARGGVWYSIPMGSIEAVENYNQSIIYKDMFLVGAFLIMAVFYFCLYITNRKDKASLYFVLVCICALIRVGIYGDYSISRIFPMMSYYATVKLDYISIYWIGTTYSLLIGEIFPEQKSKRIISLLVIYASAMSLLTLFSPIIIYTTISYFIEGMLVITCAYAFLCTLIAFYKKIPGTPAIMLGSIIALLSSIHDVLYQNNYVHSAFGEFSSFAFLVLVLIQAIIMARRFKVSIDEAQAAKLAFLQAQIKPHFLHNTINTIISISRYDSEKSRELLGNFSSYLRRSFDFKDLKQTVPLKNELELAKAYVDIEKARFEDDLEVVFETDCNAESKVPILMLQPVIENAVNHGVLPKEDGGSIEITVMSDNKYLRFAVRDNGIGMDEEKLRSLLHHNNGSGVALSNIDNRLKSLYGKGLIIKSVLGEGTTIEWCIPLDRLE